MENIILEKAKAEDVEDICNLIYETEMHPDYEWGNGTEEELRSRLDLMIKQPDNRFSLENIIVCRENGNFVGMLLSQEGKNIKPLTFKSDIKLLPLQSSLKEKIKYAIFNITYGYLFYKECKRDEYYISNIAVKDSYRGKGYGSYLMDEADKLAKELSYSKISLNANNEKLVELYKTFGFVLEEGSEMKMVKIL